MSQRYRRPTILLLLLWLLCLALGAATAWHAARQPSLGLVLEAAGDAVRVAEVIAPQGAAIPPGARILSLNGMALRIGDLNNDPDMLLSFTEMDEYFARLDAFSAIVHGSEVSVAWSADGGAEQTTLIRPHTRDWHALPAELWFVWLVGSLCLLIGAWVYVLKPRDQAARLFALSGVLLMMAALPTAVYYARDLSYSGTLLRGLLAINHFGAYLYVATMIGLFLSYPRVLVRPIHLWVLSVPYLLLFVLDATHFLVEAEDHLLAIATGVLLMFAAAGVQWWQTRQQPLERAALRWFLLAMLVGLSLTTATLILPPLFDMPPLLNTAHTFGFFLIMYIGIALGLRRYRLFDMNEWAYRVLLWVGGATLVIVLDALLIVAGLSLGVSFGVSLLLGGWLYFPLRQWLWQRMIIRHTPNFESLLPELSAVAFAPVPAAQLAGWEALLRRIYEPLELQVAATDETPGIGEDGLVMVVPGSGELPPLRLRHAGHGTRLFSSRDAAFAASLSQALERMMGGRNSFEEGATQERQRIYRDLHDDMGAKLLGLAISAQRANLPKEADLARSALQDLRDVVSRDMHAPTPLADLLADWRMEAQQRAQAAGVVLEWRFPAQELELLLTPEAALNLTRLLREAISNVLRHAQASHLRVTTALDEQAFTLSVEDDGIGLPDTPVPHRGMSSMQARAAALGAALDWQTVQPQGCRVTLSVPLAALTP